MNKRINNSSKLQWINFVKHHFIYILQTLIFCCFVFSFVSSLTFATSFNIQSNKNKKIPSDQPVLMGYYSQWAIYSPNVHIQDLPLHLMSHLVYKSALLSANGTIEPGDSFADVEHLYPDANIEQDMYLGNFGQLIKFKKQHPKLNNIISIGGWGRSQYFSSLSMTAIGRSTIAKSAIVFMQKYKFDGIEIDWQFPIKRASTSEQTLITHRASDAVNLNLLLAEIKRQLALLTEKYWLQVILAPYSLDDQWQANLLNNSVDLVILDVSRIYGDKEMLSDHLAPLYAKPERKSIDQLIKKLNDFGVKNEKLVVSIPSFAIGLEGVSNNNDGLQQKASNVSWGSWDGQGSGATGLYTRKSLSFIFSLGNYRQFWDALGQSSYLYNKDKFNGHFIAFENERSIAAKVDYITKNKLAGIAVNQLHNGTYVLEQSFFNFHYLRGIYYQSIGFWRENSNTLLPIVQFFIIILIIFFTVIRLLSVRNTVLLRDKRKLQLLQSNLQNLEWPLLNLFKIAPELYKRELLDKDSVEHMVKASSQLLKPVSAILSDTYLNRPLLKQANDSLDLHELLNTTKQLFYLSKKHQINWDRAINCQLYVDITQFQQFFYNLCVFCFENMPKKEHLDISFTTTTDDFFILIKPRGGVDVTMMNHAQLKPLFNQAKFFGLQLNIVEETYGIFQLLVPVNQCRLVGLTAEKLNFDITCLDNTSNILDDCRPNKATQNPLEITKEITSSAGSHTNELLDNIALFNISSLPSKDIFKGLEHACQFFFNHLQQDSKISIHQSEQLVSKLGDESLTLTHEKVINADEFFIKITTKTALSNEDEQLIRVLISQTQMIQKALQSLIKEPSMLAELHELTRYKESIQYLKAESGYTGLYLQGKKDPRYISMRLRTVKLYFDDLLFIQIHRSYLVNPKKVSHVESVSKLKFELIIGKKKLPISRTYISILKATYPHWFASTK